jgi:hypothetical protein
VKIVSIDPSINNVGWALVDGLTRDEHGVWDDSNTSWRWGDWKIGSNSLSYKLREIAEWMIVEFDGLDSDEDWLVLEYPAYFGSAKGQVAAQMGHTLGLATIDGYLPGFFRLPSGSFHFVTANQWKGNLSKEMTRKRFFHRLGVKQIYAVNHNAVDAVMLLHEFAKRRQITFKIVDANLTRQS